MRIRNFSLIVLFVFVMVFMSGCFINEQVEANEVSVETRGGEIIRCVSPGVHTNLGFFADLNPISGATLTFQVSDPEVATKDNQLVGVLVTIQARRRIDCDSAKYLLSSWPALLDDKTFTDTISANAGAGIKVGTRSFTLAGLLDDRNSLADSIKAGLDNVSEEYRAQIVNVTVGNIELKPEYAAQLNTKALLTAQIETALRQQDLIKQQASNDQLAQDQRKLVLDKQLAAEQAQTSVQVEIASRSGKEVAARTIVYSQNPQAYELERLNRLATIFGDKAVTYFIQQGTDLNLFFTPQGLGNVVPVAP
jgi:hypothetical protein